MFSYPYHRLRRVEACTAAALSLPQEYLMLRPTPFLTIEAIYKSRSIFCASVFEQGQPLCGECDQTTVW